MGLTKEEIAVAEKRPEDLDIIFRFSPLEGDNVTGHDDLAEEYMVERCPGADSGLVVWCKYWGKWIANPSCRPVIRQLFRNFGIKIYKEPPCSTS